VETSDVGPEQGERSSAAPGELEVVRAFVNTLDIEAGTDDLGTPADAGAWLRRHGAPLRRGPSRDDLRRLVELREAIRDAASARGTDVGAKGIAALNRVAAAHPISVLLGEGPVPFAHRTSGVDGFIERLLGIVATATVDGSWERLKACPNDRCRWLFFDHSRNRSRTWCSMDVCGARAKMRTYRSRRRADVAADRGEHAST
jgi:predicted RNA-binding Zn ribbon-like protein